MTDTITTTATTSSPARFITPPLGLEPRTDFTLEPVLVEHVATAPGLYALIHADGVRLRVLDMSVRRPDYASAEAKRYSQVVDAEQIEDVQVLVTLTVHEDGITANLDAPLIVNRVTGTAQQMVHPGELTQLRVPIKEVLG